MYNNPLASLFVSSASCNKITHYYSSSTKVYIQYSCYGYSRITEHIDD